jgi:hypothetical protein
MTDQPDKHPADTDDTKQAQPSDEEPETTIVASDTTTVDRDELAWSLDDTDAELKAEHRSWTDTWKTTAMILASAALVAAMVGGLIWAWHAVNRHSAALSTPTPASTPSAAAPTPSAAAPTPSPAAPTSSTPAVNSPAIVNPDISYLNQLRQFGLDVQNPAGAVATAHMICAQFQQGHSKVEVVGWLAEQQPLGHLNAGRVVDAATTAYCPQYYQIPPSVGP